jgi:hypothetical protein
MAHGPRTDLGLGTTPACESAACPDIIAEQGGELRNAVHHRLLDLKKELQQARNGQTESLVGVGQVREAVRVSTDRFAASSSLQAVRP